MADNIVAATNAFADSLDAAKSDCKKATAVVKTEGKKIKGSMDETEKLQEQVRADPVAMQWFQTAYGPTMMGALGKLGGVVNACRQDKDFEAAFKSLDIGGQPRPAGKAAPGGAAPGGGHGAGLSRPSRRRRRRPTDRRPGPWEPRARSGAPGPRRDRGRLFAPMQAHRRVLVSEAEFLALPESTQRIELLDGEVIVSPSPTFWHQEILQRLIVALRRWASGRPVTVGLAPMDVRFQPGWILQPDAFVIVGTVPRDQVGPLTEVPALCIEVVSGDRVYDRITKRLIYARAGVREYWVIEPAGVVERFSGDDLGEVEEVRKTLRTAVLDGFELDLGELFRFDEPG